MRDSFVPPQLVDRLQRSPMTNALMAPQGQPMQAPLQFNALQGGPQQPQQPAPAPTHAQAVAVLRHASATAKELKGLLDLPELGRSDVKSQIISGTTDLVARRIMTPAQAVSMLSTVATDPLQQRKWAQMHYANSMSAMNNVPDHHRAAFPGTGDIAVEAQRSQSDPDKHFDDVNAAMSHYSAGGSNVR